MPVTPAHSATRKIDPKFWGSVTPSSTNKNGFVPPCVRANTSSSTGWSGAANAMTPCGASVRAIASNLLRDTSRSITRSSSASSEISSRIWALSISAAKMTSRVRRVPASNNSRTACRPSTWSPPRPLPRLPPEPEPEPPPADGLSRIGVVPR